MACFVLFCLFLMGILCASWIWMSVSFPRLGKFSNKPCSNKPSASFSFSSPMVFAYLNVCVFRRNLFPWTSKVVSFTVSAALTMRHLSDTRTQQQQLEKHIYTSFLYECTCCCRNSRKQEINVSDIFRLHDDRAKNIHTVVVHFIHSLFFFWHHLMSFTIKVALYNWLLSLSLFMHA